MQRSGLPALTVQGWFRLVFVVIAVLVIAAGIVIAYLLAMGRTVSGELEGGADQPDPGGALVAAAGRAR
jgi:hypothetical protein